MKYSKEELIKLILEKQDWYVDALYQVLVYNDYEFLWDLVESKEEFKKWIGEYKNEK